MGLLDRLFGRKPRLPKIRIGVGHRGIAAGDLEKRRQAAERYGRTGDPADRPYTEEEIERFRLIPAEDVRAFVYEGDLLTVHSTNVLLAQYFPYDQKMMVEFKNGHAYVYSGVTLDEAAAFAAAASKGAWVIDHLIGRHNLKGNDHWLPPKGLGKHIKPCVKLK